MNEEYEQKSKEEQAEVDFDEDLVCKLEEIIRFETNGDIVVKLEFPLKPWVSKGADPFLGIGEVRMKPLFAGNMLTAQSSSKDEGFQLVFNYVKESSGMPKAFLERLDPDDFAKLAAVLSEVMGKSRKTSGSVQEFLRRRSAGRQETSEK